MKTSVLYPDPTDTTLKNAGIRVNNGHDNLPPGTSEHVECLCVCVCVGGGYTLLIDPPLALPSASVTFGFPHPFSLSGRLLQAPIPMRAIYIVSLREREKIIHLMETGKLKATDHLVTNEYLCACVVTTKRRQLKSREQGLSRDQLSGLLACADLLPRQRIGFRCTHRWCLAGFSSGSAQAL
jgi:hypothetical protein